MPQLVDFIAMMKKAPLSSRIVMVILLCYPALLLTVKGGMGILFVLLLLTSVVCLYRLRNSLAPIWDNYSLAFSLAMASPVLSIFLSQAHLGEFRASSYDWASRFLLSIPIFLALRRMDVRTVTVLQLGLPLGSIIALIVLILSPYEWSATVHTTSQAFNLIHFSDTALMLGFLSLFSINWEKKDDAPILILKVSGFLAGLYMSIQSGERGGWVAIPLLLLLWVTVQGGGKLWLKLLLTVLAVSCVIGLSYLMIDVVHYRIDSVFDDLNKYALNDKDTSIGLRLQLYTAALHLFIEHPLFGVGPEGFGAEMPALVANGMLTPLAGEAGLTEVHNEILAKCAGTGLFGLLSILSVFLVPLFILLRLLKSIASTVRIASLMGICLILGFFVFGLTVEIFNLKMTASFFSLTLAVLMAAATSKGNKATDS